MNKNRQASFLSFVHANQSLLATIRSLKNGETKTSTTSLKVILESIIWSIELINNEQAIYQSEKNILNKY